MENANNYKLASKICDYVVNQIDFGRKISIWDIEKILNDNIPHERVVKPTLAEDCVEIHLNYSTDGTLRVFGWTPYGEREELDILMGEIVTAHNDHYEVDKSALFRILAKLLQNGQKYIISGG